MSKFTFDMPHALVTLTDVDGDVEIEVWPKTGQSAYVVVPPAVARAIADRILRMADAAEASHAALTTPEGQAPGAQAPGAQGPGALPMNVVDLASRRKPN